MRQINFHFLSKEEADAFAQAMRPQTRQYIAVTSYDMGVTVASCRLTAEQETSWEAAAILMGCYRTSAV